MLDDIMLREDLPDDWAEAEIRRGAHEWPSGDVPRARVRVGDHSKPELLVRRLKAFAELVGMFYNSMVADQLVTLASDFAFLADKRANGRRVYPLVMLSVAYETLMFKFMVAVRSQAIKLIFHLEHMQKSVVRPHLFTNLRLAMMGRDENRGMAFVWPSFFMNALQSFLLPHHSRGML